MQFLLTTPDGRGPHPLLVFLHGYDEGAPTELRSGVTRHGPLRPGSAAHGFAVLAPQLPACGDHWALHADEVLALARAVENVDASRVYLTGFSFGGNGVFDLALLQPEMWAAAWAVDPTRVPPREPELPLWLSLGNLARRNRDALLRAMPHCMWRDEGLDHVGTATSAYRDAEIYAWLLIQRRSSR